MSSGSKFSLADLEGVTTGNVCDAQGKVGHMAPYIRPLYPRARVVGPAFTVVSRPGDNLAVHRAIEVAPPGSVLVVTTGGYKRAGFFGGIMAFACRVKGILGLVTDGACRDSGELEEMDFPVFAAGTSPGGTIKADFGQLAVPVVCGGVLVRPGDVIFGDRDGVVVVPAEKAEKVFAGARAIVARERTIRESLLAGKSTMEIYGFPRPEK